MPSPLTRVHPGSVLICTTFPTRHSTVHRCLKVVAPANTFTSRNTRLPLVETVSMLGVTSCSHSICTTRDGSADTGAHDCHHSPTTHSSWPILPRPTKPCTTLAAFWFGPLASARNRLFSTDRHQVLSPGRPHLEAWALLRYASRSSRSHYISATMTATVCNATCIASCLFHDACTLPSTINRLRTCHGI
jgi:hypothetical protein